MLILVEKMDSFRFHQSEISAFERILLIWTKSHCEPFASLSSNLLREISSYLSDILVPIIVQKRFIQYLDMNKLKYVDLKLQFFSDSSSTSVYMGSQEWLLCGGGSCGERGCNW